MSDKLSDESLPCPFCGCTDISEGEVLTENPDGGASTQSMCRGCGALGPDAHLREGEVDFGSVKSTAAWNRRASPAPAIPMPPLNDAMRAVLTNENCIYGTPDELYAALVMAAPAIPAADPVAIRDAALEAAAAAVENHQRAGREWVNGSLWDTLSREAAARIRALKAAPAISESDMLRHRAVAAEARLEHVIKILTRIHGFLLPNDVRLPDGRIFEFNNPEAEHEMLRGLRDAILAVPDEIAAIDAARKGEKS